MSETGKDTVKCKDVHNHSHGYKDARSSQGKILNRKKKVRTYASYQPHCRKDRLTFERISPRRISDEHARALKSHAPESRKSRPQTGNVGKVLGIL